MKQWNTKKIAMLGVLVALQITASRLLGINLSPSLRLSISDSFILLAGIWFGPVGGALTGGLADLTGCLLKGEAYLPILGVSPILVGFLAGLAAPALRKSKNILVYGGVIAAISCVTSVLYRSWAFSQAFGMSFLGLLGPRALQAVFMVIANTMVVYALYRSPVTAMVYEGQEMGNLAEKRLLP